MQWNCPHCGIKLMIADDSVHSGWSFSKCATCAGFALVRRVEINVIKVDKAPPGENVLLPDALTAGGAQGLMGAVATRNLARIIPPAGPNKNVQSQNLPTRPVLNTGKVEHEKKFPEPLPELLLNPRQTAGVVQGAPPTTATLRKLPLGIAVAAFTSVASGAYFYMQAQALWHRAHEQVAAPQVPTLVITDQIQDTATAPIKPVEVSH